MHRWGLVILGLVMAYFGVNHWLAFEPLEESAMPASAEEAASLLRSRDRQFILLDAKLDAGRRMYRTGIAAPAYAVWPRDALQPLSNADLDRPAVINRLLGCQTQITGRVNPVPMTIELIRKNGQQPSTWTIHQRLLAVVEGSQGRIFALSPVFAPTPPQDDSGQMIRLQTQWLKQTEFKGLLTRMADLHLNTSGMSQRVADIKRHFAQNGVHIPRAAYVILTDHAIEYGESQETRLAPNIVPIDDSDGRLFLEVTKQQERTLVSPIDGVLMPVDGQRYHDFARILGKPLPSRIGIVKLQTAAQHNQAERIKAASGVGIGLGCTGCGFWLIIRRIQKKRRKDQEWQECRKAVEIAKRRPLPKADPSLELLTRLGR